MSHFAEIKNGIVVRVIVAGQDFINSGAVGDPSLWKQCSYNTRRGVHYQPNSDIPSEDQSKALRKNFPGVNYIYDEIRDAFIPPKPYNSWVLNESTCIWECPVPYPNDGKDYAWAEPTLSWIEFIE